MKKTQLALSISCALSLTSFANLAAAQTTNQGNNEQTVNENIENIVVTANRSTQDKFDVLAAVDIFTRDDIEEIQPISVADLLSRVAGITVATQGTPANSTSLFVRGSNSDHVLVLVNGVRVGSATLGVKDIASIPVQLIERIEIVRGVRAALWGSDAIGGVIQIFTRQLNNGEAQVGATFGTHNYKQGYGAIALGNDSHNYTLSATVEKSNGFDILKPAQGSFSPDQSDKDGYDRQSIALTGTSQLSSKDSLEVNGQYDQGSYQFDASHFFGGDETDYENYQLLIRNHLQLNDYYLQTSVATSQDNNEDNFTDYGAAQNSFFTTKRDQASLLIQLPFADNNDSEIIAGIDWYQEKVSSSTLYSQLKRSANAIYVTGRHQLQQLKLEASLRRDKVGNIDSETTYQLAAGYQLTDNTLIALTHGTAFKAPTFNALYWPADTFFQGNKDLKPETARNTEILARYQNETYRVELSLYQTLFDDLIINGPADANNPWGLWTPNNVASATVKGAEASISANYNSFSHQLTLSHIDAQDDSSKEQLLRRPYFSANYTLAYHLNDWNIAIDINHQGKRYDNANFVRTKLASYTLVNFNVNYQVSSQLTLHAKIANLADRSYQHVPEYQGDQRNVKVSLDYRF
jgi:vitamin B12 transporter